MFEGNLFLVNRGASMEDVSANGKTTQPNAPQPFTMSHVSQNKTKNYNVTLLEVYELQLF